MTHVAYLALGTNLGDRLANLRAALDALPPEVRVLVTSPVYETPPWGYTRQPPFLNMVARAATDLPPTDLLTYLKHLEADLGRTPTFRYGPRRIDLDILFYDDLTLETPSLVIPHPRLHERAFVLVPLADLAPDLRHPALGKTVRELLKAVDTSGIYRYADPLIATNCHPASLLGYNQNNPRRCPMTETKIKPLNWKPVPGIGYTVVRRPDGGMHYTFTDLSEKTVQHWREFAYEHLFDSDRLTRNLYDLRQVKEIPDHAVRAAIEVNSDPAARNIRLAVVVSSEAVKEAVMEIAAASPTEASAAIRVFTNMDEAEEWLSKPLDTIV